MIWLPAELHCHTLHSDGAMEPETLAAQGTNASFGALALTDHNTASARSAYAAAAQRRGLVPIAGVELTTFFGHVLVWGAAEAPDWRFLGASDLGPALKTLGHRDQLVIGAAHPFRPGNPFCTGCHWDYDVPFDDLDCLEVWSGLDPDLEPTNHQALALWTDLLNQGIALTPTAGRDWHRPDPAPGLRSATLLGVSEPSPEACLDALRAGRTVVTLGPRPWLEVGEGGVRFGAEDSGWGEPLASFERARVELVTARGTVGEGGRWIGDAATLGWARVEVRGHRDGVERLVAVSNAWLAAPRPRR